LDIVDPTRLAALHIDLVGAGGVGSPTGLCLAKLGCTDLRVFDPDHVAEVNLAAQLYRREDATRGVLKVEAAQALWQAFSAARVEAVPQRAEDHRLHGIVILAVDSMAARTAIWQRCLRDQPQVQAVIDARMGAESGTLITIRPLLPDDQRFYEISLYRDDEALPLPCTGRAVGYNTLWLAALIARQVKRLAMQQPLERRIDFDLDSLTLMID
jgi:molybdopterin/thiamine biosynthesis adenylyltransferase